MMYGLLLMGMIAAIIFADGKLRKLFARSRQRRKYLCTFCGYPDAPRPFRKCPACASLSRYSPSLVETILLDYEASIDAQKAAEFRAAQGYVGQRRGGA